MLEIVLQAAQSIFLQVKGSNNYTIQRYLPQGDQQNDYLIPYPIAKRDFGNLSVHTGPEAPEEMGCKSESLDFFHNMFLIE